MGGKLEKKKGVLPITKYDPDIFNVTPFQTWLRQYSFSQDAPAVLGGAALTALAAADTVPAAPAPLSYICGVYVSHAYRFIFIRTRKTASTTIMNAFKAALNRNDVCGNATQCRIKRFSPGRVSDPDQLWRDYTVLTSSRNMWARGASAHEFTHGQWANRVGACALPSFEQYCRDPYLMGKLANLFKCGGSRPTASGRIDWSFDFCHVEPAYHCMQDDEGRMAVDYVIRYERLEDDMRGALALINSRRPEGLAELTAEQMGWRQKGAAARATGARDSGSAAYAYAGKLRQCGGPCAQALFAFYRADAELLGWDDPGDPPEGDPGGPAAGSGGVAHHARQQHAMHRPGLLADA